MSRHAAGNRSNAYRLIAAVLVFVMVLEFSPLIVLAAPPGPGNPQLGSLEEISSDETSSDGTGSEETSSDEASIGSPAVEAAGIIVKMKEPHGSMGAQGMPADVAQQLGIEGAEEVASAGPLHLLSLGEGVSAEEALEALEGNDLVEYAEPNYILSAQLQPDDPDYLSGKQWGLSEIEIEDAWARAVQVLSEADPARSPADVVVAVIDTGIDMAHEDLDSRIAVTPPDEDLNLLTPEVDAPWDDSWSGHGTHIAGIIAAETNNGLGIAGAAGGLPVTILPIKVLDEAGVGTMYHVAQGIQLAKRLGADIINLSLGARLVDFPYTLAGAVMDAQDAGILVVAAAGNEGRDNVHDFYPACLPGVLAVQATQEEDHQVAAFSNDVANCVQAPGVDIYSTLPGLPGSSAVSRYGSLSGTSQAAGFVSRRCGAHDERLSEYGT